MKNIFLVVFTILSLCILSLGVIDTTKVVPDDAIKSYSIIIDSNDFGFESDNYVELGFATQLFVDKNLYSKLRSDFDYIGESISFYKQANIVERISTRLGLVVLERQYISGYEIIYAYSKKLDSKPINGSNIQIAWKGDYVVMGLPIIFGEI